MASRSTEAGHSGPEERVRLLAERADGHARRGELAAAHELYRQILAIESSHPEALSFVATAALQSGEVQRGVALLEQAVAAHPANANLHKNLGIAYRAAGDTVRALAEFTCALELKPDLTPALFNQAALLAETGREDEALSVYIRAFESAEALGMFLDIAKVPAGIRAMAERGLQLLQQARLQMFREKLAPLEREHGRAALERVWHCLEAFLGLRRAIPLPRLQRPTFMTF